MPIFEYNGDCNGDVGHCFCVQGGGAGGDEARMTSLLAEAGFTAIEYEYE